MQQTTRGYRYNCWLVSLLTWIILICGLVVIHPRPRALLQQRLCNPHLATPSTPTTNMSPIQSSRSSPPVERIIPTAFEHYEQEEEDSAESVVSSHGPVPRSLSTGSNFMDVALLLRTLEFAANKHEHQRRKNRNATPYINHPLGVANILSAHGVTHLPTLQAAILHDTVEDTDTDLDELVSEFGEEVARIVSECSDPPGLSSRESKALQVRTAPFKSREAQQVKLGDKLHNLRSIMEDPPVGWTPKRCQEYFRWAKNVTDICLPSLPSIAFALDEIYHTNHFVLDGKAHKCHPDINAKGEVSEREQKRIKSLVEKERREKRNGLVSPLFT